MADGRVAFGGGDGFTGTPAAFDPRVAHHGRVVQPVDGSRRLEAKSGPAERGGPREARRKSASRGSAWRLCPFGQLQVLSSRSLRFLAPLVSSHDDPAALAGSGSWKIRPGKLDLGRRGVSS